jgi:hypothetical protein
MYHSDCAEPSRLPAYGRQKWLGPNMIGGERLSKLEYAHLGRELAKGAQWDAATIGKLN